MISGVRLPFMVESPPRRFCTAAVAMTVRGQSALTAIPCGAKLLRHPEDAHAHPELGHRVGHVRREPALLQVERRRQVQDVRVRGLQQVRHARLGAGEGAARVDLVHEVVALHRRLEGAGEADGARVVDENVDAAERRDRLLDGGAICSSSRTSTMQASALPPAFSISSAAV
jgi:hypothetical protein